MLNWSDYLDIVEIHEDGRPCVQLKTNKIAAYEELGRDGRLALERQMRREYGYVWWKGKNLLPHNDEL